MKRRRSSCIYLAAVSFALGQGAAASAQTSTRAATPETLESVEAAIDAEFKNFSSLDGPGAAVGLYRGGRPVLLKGYGAASVEHGVAIDADTAFDLASTSKQFTAACVVLLALEGKLDLDDSLRKHLPSLPAWADAVTIKHCVFHTSGIRDYIALLMFRGVRDRDVSTDDDAMRALERQRGLCFPPGSKHEYSNSGYFLLSRVVEAASGKSLAAFAKERIFDPLGMTATRFVDDQTDVVRRRATGYAPKGRGFAINMSNWEQTGDGAVVTSLVDLGKWIENFKTGAVGGPKFLERMKLRGALDDGTSIDYGFGLVHEKSGDLEGISHGGAWAGYRSELIRLPDEDLAVAVLCNRSDADASGRARKVLKIARESGLGAVPPIPGAKPAERAKRDRAPTSRVAPPAATPEYVAAFVGVYASEELDVSWTVEATALGIRVRGPGETDAAFMPQAPDVFGSLMGMTLRFERDAADRPARFIVKLRGVDGLVFERR